MKHLDFVSSIGADFTETPRTGGALLGAAGLSAVLAPLSLPVMLHHLRQAMVTMVLLTLFDLPVPLLLLFSTNRQNPDGVRNRDEAVGST